MARNYGLGAGIFMVISKGPDAVGKWIKDQISNLTDEVAKQFMEKVKVIPESMHGILGLDGKRRQELLRGSKHKETVSEGIETAEKNIKHFSKTIQALLLFFPKTQRIFENFGNQLREWNDPEKTSSGSSEKGRNGLLRFILRKTVSAPFGIIRLF